MKTARRIKPVEGFTGLAWLYRMEPSLECRKWIDGGGDWNGYEVTYTRYVVSSSTFAPFSGAETLVFQSDSMGEVSNWSKVGGSRGIMDCDEALEEVGYEVVWE